MSDYISREALTEAFENADADVCESFPDGYCDWGFGNETGAPAAALKWKVVQTDDAVQR